MHHRHQAFASGSSIVASGAFLLLGGCAGDAPDDPDPIITVIKDVSPSSFGQLALANVGGTACGHNSLGGTNFYTSCHGNGGSPEYWCSDFVKWVWANNGIDVQGLTAAAGSFYVYGQNHGTLKNQAAVGDAVVFDYAGGGVADHVAIVTKVNPDGRIETASGDWNGESGSQAHFASTAHVVLNVPAYPGVVGSSPGIIGMTISGFISPGGVGDSCAVHNDGKLYCLNNGGAAMHQQATLSSPIVNHLRTTYSYFDCWGTGDLHAGGNTTWYRTVGDDNTATGWVPAVELETTSAFDANPVGLAHCQ